MDASFPKRPRLDRLTVRRIIVLILVSTLMGCSSPQESVGEDATKPLVVFLVRHAEKVDSSADPELSAAGIGRARTLATTLRSAQIENVHSSDFIRTRNTAAPAAAALGLEVRLYDPRDLPGFAARLLHTGGRHFVVGHSNTTPAMVRLLGGDPASDIDEAGEYDRLYIVTVGKDGAVSSALLRFGEPYIPLPLPSGEGVRGRGELREIPPDGSDAGFAPTPALPPEGGGG